MTKYRTLSEVVTGKKVTSADYRRIEEELRKAEMDYSNYIIEKILAGELWK